MTAEDIAQHIAGILDGDYDDGLEAYVSARADGASVVVTVDGEPEARKFRAVLVEVVE